MTTTRKGLGGILAVSIMVGALATAAPAVEQACARENADVETLNLGVERSKRAYRKGQDARLEISVTRALEAGGQRIEEAPVEGAEVTVAVSIGDSVLAAGGTTDARGVAKVSVRLKRWIDSGWADVFVLARKEHVDAPCLRASEYGRAAADRFFRVRG